MSPRRRWFQFSLRGFLVVLTVFAVWLGVIANRAREQREVVKAIEAMGGSAVYDYQLQFMRNPWLGFDYPWVDHRQEPPGPAWLRSIIGNELFQDIAMISFHNADESTVLYAIPLFKRMRGLRLLIFNNDLSAQAMHELETALPNCDIQIRHDVR